MNNCGYVFINKGGYYLIRNGAMSLSTTVNISQAIIVAMPV